LIPVGAVLLAFLLAVAAPAAPAPTDGLRSQALQHEKEGNWLQACRDYDDLIRRDRGDLSAREGYHRCFRQYQILRRHSDRTYRDALKVLQPSDAMEIYDSVLTTVALTYVDRNKTDLASLLKHGVQELRYALDQPVFVQQHLPGATPDTLRQFKERLANWPDRKVESLSDVHIVLPKLAGIAQQLKLIENRQAFAVVLALEFSFGACTGLDEYSLFLTPAQHEAIASALRGKLVGVGIEVAVNEQGLVVSRIYPNSPAAAAAMKGFTEGSRIVRIDKHIVDEQTRVDQAAEWLRGPDGSTVTLRVILPGQEEEQPFELRRQPVFIPSVEYHMVSSGEVSPLTPEGIGYLRITHFQDTTAQEVREALAQLQTQPVPLRGLILDLRGNPGGSVMPAVKVAELFLPEGVIVNMSSRFKDFDGEFRVRDSMSTFTLPMGVLIDGETASAAELLAGALRENGRAQLFGQTTFGKGSVQCIIPLEKSPGGIRITVAKFTSPRKNQYTNTGVAPNFPVDPREALMEAVRELNRMSRSMPMPMSNGMPETAPDPM
jgi:carboxyl-terminal processing protease